MPSFREHNRQYDIVVFGATGYTGKWTAEHIAQTARTDLKWAIAGRSESKLRALADEIKQLNPDRQAPGIEIANLSDADLTALAKKTCILITTVGPYAIYGEHAFKACAENGTHYLDVTGEAPWVFKMIKKYEKVAKSSGAIMLPQCGIESAPSDLLTWSLAQEIRNELGAPTKDVTVSVHKLNSAPSGGTLATALALFEQFSLKEIEAASAPYAQSPVPHEEPQRQKFSIVKKLLGIQDIPNLGIVTTAINESADIAVVERTWGLLSSIPSKKEQSYGPRFTWSSCFKTRNWLSGIAMHWLLIIAGMLFAFVPPFRTLVRKFVYQPGQGVEREVAARDEIEYRAIANPDSDEFAGKQAYGKAYFRGGMYYLTGILVSEAVMTILEEDTGLDGGIFTPACLGQGFIDRANKAGFRVETKVMDV